MFYGLKIFMFAPYDMFTPFFFMLQVSINGIVGVSDFHEKNYSVNVKDAMYHHVIRCYVYDFYTTDLSYNFLFYLRAHITYCY